MALKPYDYGKIISFFDESRGKWRSQVSYKDENGERKKKSFSGKTKKEAEAKMKAFLKDENRQKLERIKGNQEKTIVCILKEIEDRKLRFAKIKESTYDRNYSTIKNIESYNIGSVPIHKIDKAMIDEFLIGFRDVGYSESVVKKVYAALKRAYRKAFNEGLVAENLMETANIERPETIAPPKKVTAFTVEQQKQFEEVLHQKRFQSEYVDYDSMLEIEMHTGMRMGEISALTKADIDFENHVIHISKTVSRNKKGRPVVGAPKTKASIRTIPFSQTIEPVLREVVKNYKDNPYAFLFYDNRNNHPVYSQMVNSYFTRLCDKNGIKRSGGQHMLRHTFATRVIEAGIAAVVLQKWLGHKKITTTLETYTDVFDQLNNQSINMLEKYAAEKVLAPKTAPQAD